MEKITCKTHVNKKKLTQKWLYFFVFIYSLFGVAAMAQTVDLGSGTDTSTANTADAGLGPMNGYYVYMRYQVVYTAAEITAAGGIAGNYIEEFGFNVATPAASTLNDYTIRLANTTETNSAAHNTTALTEVYSGDVTAVAGYNMIELTMPFLWDGTSNILVDVCYGPVDFVSPYGTVFTYGTDDDSSRFARSDFSSRCGTDTNLANSFKPQARLVMVPPPSCFPVLIGTMEVSDITINSATLTWDEPDNAPSEGYQYYVSDENTEPTAGTTPTGSVTTALTTDLTVDDPFTTYYVWVRANCGEDDFSEWTGPVTFATLQIPATLPFTDGFETESNWILINGAQTNKWFVGDAVNNGGTQSLYVSDNASGTNNSYSNTTSTVHAYRDIAVPADVDFVDLSFDWKAGGESTWDYLRVWLVPTTYTPAAGTQTTAANSSGVRLAQYLNLSEGEFITEEFQLSTSTYAGQTVRLIFEWRNDGGGGVQPAAAIDNVSLTEATCIVPAGLATVISPGSVDLSWDLPSNLPASGYDYYIDDENTSPTSESDPTGNVPTGGSVSITTLAPDTVHYFWIRANCDDTTTEWVSGGSFRTDCDAAMPSFEYQDFSTYNGGMPGPDCWREATGELSDAPTYLGAGSSSWTNENYNNTTGENGRAARLNLYGEDNEWIISPAIDLGDGSIEYQLEYDASVLPWSGSDPVTDMEEKEVKVVISTDGGASWVDTNVVMTYDNGNIPAGGVSEAIPLTGYTGVVKVGFYGYSTTEDLDLRFYIDNFRIIEVPQCDKPLEFTLGEVDKETAEISWTEPEIAPAEGYEYYVGEDDEMPAADETPTGTVEAGITEVTVTGLTPSTTNYIWVRSACEDDLFSEWIGPLTAATLCDYPDILSTTPDSVCGQGEATLEAEAESGSLYWYEAESGGAYLAIEDAFTTPLITETTSFYVSSGTPLPDSVVPVGEGATTSDTYSNPFYSLWSNNHTQHLITAAELQAAGLSAGDITSVALDVTSAGSLPMIDLSVKIGTTTATSMEAFVAADDLDVVFTSESYMPTAGVNTLTFTTPFNWDGTSNIVLEFCHGNEDSGATMSRTVKADNTSYVSSVKRHFSSGTSADEVCSATTGGTLASYSVRPQFIFNGVGICFSPRVEVIATVTDAPDVTTDVSEDTICEGESTDISVTSENADYTYVWMPGNLEGAAQTVSPVATTTYIITATDADTGCVEVGEVTVTVNPLPVITEDLTDMEVCEGGVMPLTFGVENSAMGAFGTGESNSVAQSTGGTLGPNPLQNYYGGVKQQWIYTAEELTAMGMVEGSAISSLTLNLNTANPDLDLEGLEVKMKNTAQASFATTTSWIADMTTVMTATDYTPATGINTFALTTPFVWDGESSLAVQMSFSNDNAPSAGTNSAKFSATDFTSTIFYRADNQLPEEMEAYTGTATATYSQRNDVTFEFNQPLEVEWSPITNLYTDEEATVPYTGEPAAMVYTKPVADITYSATATSLEGCSVTSAAANITINVVEAPTVTETAQPFCGSATVADLEATGEEVKWYYAETGGTAITETTQLLDGTMYYASQTVDGCESVARAAVTAEVTVTPAPEVEEDVLNICNEGTVADLMDAATGTDVQWYTDITGGEALTEDTALEEGVNLYYASQTVDECESTMRTPLVVVVNVVEAPMADAEQSFCTEGTVADLMPNTEDVMWYADETGGEPLTGDTALENGVAYYASQMLEGCESAERTEVTVTINVTDTPVADAEQIFCAEGFVSGLMADGENIMWYADETGGEPLTGDTALEDGASYYASQTVEGCESTVRAEVMVTINVTPAPDGENTQVVEVETAADATIEDLVVTGVEGGTIVWYATEEDAMNNENPLEEGSQIESETTYYAVQFVDDCASAPFAVAVTVALDSRNFNLAEFTYHPNPVKDVLNIAYSSNITSVTVYNMLGQPVLSQDVNALEGRINMATLADGTYIVNITAGEASKTIKVIKKQ